MRNLGDQFAREVMIAGPIVVALLYGGLWLYQTSGNVWTFVICGAIALAVLVTPFLRLRDKAKKARDDRS